MIRQYTQLEGTNLPPSAFLSIVGSYSHSSGVALHFHPVSEDHVFLWILQPLTGYMYECAVHTRLTYQSKMQTCMFKEPLDPERWPDFGVYQSGQTLSYEDLDLAQENFQQVGRRSLTDELIGLATRSARLQIYGFSHAQGNGLHDIHQNSGESRRVTRRNRPGQDGAIVFYYTAKPGIPAHRLWLCLKFENQTE